MRIITKYVLMVIVASACLASCTTIEKELDVHTKNCTLSVMASVGDFATLNVGTKAISDDETKVNEITMLIFDGGNNIVGRPVNLDGSGAVFMIDTQNSQIIDGNNPPINFNNDQSLLDNCTIYMVANSWSEIEGKTINDSIALLNIDMPVAGITIPSAGFPMIGSQKNFDLSKDRGDASTVANITMKKLYAKVNVRFQINADQVIKTPKFNLQSWQVLNVPNKVRLGYSDEQTPYAESAQENMLSSEESTTLSYGVQTISHSESAINPDYFQFTFYVPEHKVNPLYTEDTYPNYPTNIPDSEKQRYKPLLCYEDGSGDKKPMYVTVKGAYTDHHGQVKNVTYSLYLGQDNTDDYHILRNQELNNIITIKGVTNSKIAEGWGNTDGTDQDNISVDHRVDVSKEGFSVAIEREALLDSHFEVRPMDIFVSTGGKAVVSVKDPDANKWLRIEKSYGVDNANAVTTNYIENVGVRKYFTTNLVTEDLATVGTTLTITDTDDSRIWLYFDENTEEPYDKTLDTDPSNPLPKYRDITLVVQYYADGATEVTSTQEFTFRQMKLWRVRNADNTRYYDIEYHEEYLHNYVSNDNYGKSKDGMAWGLIDANEEGLQLSDYMKSFYLETTFSDISNALMESSKPYYDFYITESEANGTQNYRPYSGKIFSNEIMEKVLYEVTDNSLFVSDGLLTSDPKSAVDYCYNKNKRTSNGSIITAVTSNNTTTYNTDNVQWFLPSIDQIEEIVKSAYQDFQDFQAKWYWSSQPAYDRYTYVYNAQWGLVDQVSGNFYTDDLSNARATRTIYNGTGWDSAPSGSDPTDDKTRVGTHTWTSLLVWVDHQYSKNANYDASELYSGNQPRTAINRIRCVRNTGLVSSL